MKELEKTKRISISAVLFLLVVVISLLTFRKPQYSFTNNTAKTLEFISNKSYILSISEFEQIKDQASVIIDVRSNFDFSKGHIEKAINIPLSQLLDKSSIDLLTGSSSQNPAILYGKTPEEANAAFMLLYQLGNEDIKVLSVATYYDDKQFHVKNIEIGKAKVNYATTMEKAMIQPVKKVVVKPAPKPVKKKVVVQPKKKKKMPEGGC
ncbi:rhodanese-like domain-containing protein [Lutimonas halocynthiae]|uniref:rhodanese-like domain-containing protein n=1 Tax=Lutimonas halocynthiae TaxID=1446477 RepID=UPI0025B48F82|nr:rhodanese-like domain-containing protein [Lutimonas halocynthiae]MDN3644518.1 rhodanese-like domain-containing protein [Lutimonas halocynthiae]